MNEHTTEKDVPEDAIAFIRALVNAWDCCGTCAGGVLAKRDRERDAARVIPALATVVATVVAASPLI